jgi:chromosome partitioning protein
MTQASGDPTRGHDLTRTVAFMNQKGGVGKTTSVVNLAAAVARTSRPVLLVDLDPQAHASLHLGVDPAEVERSVYDALLDPPESGVVADEDDTPWIVRTREHLDLLPAVTDLAAAEHELGDADDRHVRLRHLVDAVRHRYEFVFLDCPPSLGLLTLNGLAAAREVMVPMQAHFLALQGVGKLLETVQLVGQEVNPSLRVTGIVLCMHDEQTRHAREVVADLEAFFEGSRDSGAAWSRAKVFRPAVRRNIKLAEAPSFGQTIFEYAPGCPGAKDYEAVATSFMRDWDRMLERRNSTSEVKPATPGARASA